MRSSFDQSGGAEALKAKPDSDPREEIDAVYLWVDGADPAFRRSLEALRGAGAPSPGSDERRRFRDNDELRYSLRSVERFAPWLRKIHLVTNGQAPAWLDVTDERISLVRHEQIFADPSVLPTFNSNAIELQLRRIPGLTRRFLYFNDDVFLGREASREDFLTPKGGQFFYLQRTPLPSEAVEAAPVHDHAYAYTRRLAARSWPGAALELLPAHVPQLYDRGILARLEARFPAEIAATSTHRFRRRDDVVLRILYASCLLSEEAGDGHEVPLLEWGSSRFSFVCLREACWPAVQSLRHLARERPRFYCLNDDLGDAGRWHPTLVATRLFLRWCLPKPARFER